MKAWWQRPERPGWRFISTQTEFCDQDLCVFKPPPPPKYSLRSLGVVEWARRLYEICWTHGPLIRIINTSECSKQIFRCWTAVPVALKGKCQAWGGGDKSLMTCGGAIPYWTNCAKYCWGFFPHIEAVICMHSLLWGMWSLLGHKPWLAIKISRSSNCKDRLTTSQLSHHTIFRTSMCVERVFDQIVEKRGKIMTCCQNWNECYEISIQ